MATTLTNPQAIAQPWATGGDKATLPETSSSAGVASLNEGIPFECSLPISGGGAYVRRTDVNALGYLTTSLNFFLQNGGSFTYDAGVATAIGGYPAGAILRYTDSDGNVSIVRSMINNNTNNFVTDPTKIDGTNWEIVIAGSACAIKQIVNYQTGEKVYSANAVIPEDDTIPQITEGLEVMTLKITPTKASSRLKIDVVAMLVTTGGLPCVALFKNNEADAIACVGADTGTADFSFTHGFTHFMTAGTTSEITFKVRVGSNSGGATLNAINQNSRMFGGVCSSSITITEIT